MEFASVAFVVVLAFAPAWLLGRFSHWAKRRVLIAAALPLPGIFGGLCIAIFLHAAFSSREACGVDACGMAMAFALTGLFLAAVAFTFGLIVALIAFNLARK